MRKDWAVMTSLLLLISSVSFAGELKSEADTRALSDNVMASIATGDLNSAFDKMKPYLNISPTEVDSVLLQTKTAREQFKERFGSAIGSEFISTKTIGASLIRHLYVEKTDKTAFAWKLIFYKAKDKWVMISFNWGDVAKELCWD